MTEIDKVTRKRLIYVKRLYMHGHEHIPYGTEFDRMIAIHHFDNAIELLLKCVATSYDISFRSAFATFPTLWNKVNEKYEEEQGSELPKKTEMFQLHRIRSDVQHWGISPISLEVMNDFDAYSLDFIQKILDSVFGLEYKELFISSLVNDTRIRALLTDAEKYFADEKWKEAIEKVSHAFAHAKAKALKRRRLPTVPRIIMGLEDVDERMSILALGLDIEKYRKIMENTPAVMFPLREEPVIQWIGKLSFTRENTLFCFNFALDSILKWRL